MADDIVPSCLEVSISPSQLANSILVKHIPTGKIGFRTKTITADASDISPEIGCAVFNLGFDQLIRYPIALNGNGHACLILIEEND